MAVTDTEPVKATLGKVLIFGNPSPQMQEPLLHPKTGERIGTRSVRAEHLRQSVTRVEFYPEVDDPALVEHALSTPNDRMLTMIGERVAPSHRQYAVAINELEQIVTTHTGGQAPSWVVCEDDPELAKAAASHFDCPAFDAVPKMLLTNAGRDAVHAQHWGTSAQPAAFNFLALANAATATAPAAGDTTLVGEITTAGGGLIRAQATYAHTAGTNTTTLTRTFTANATDALPVTVSQTASFNASTAGTIGEKTPLNANATLNVSGDNVAVTVTDTAG